MIFDFKELEHKLRVDCSREALNWFFENLSPSKQHLLNEYTVKSLFVSIYKNDDIFKLYVFDNLRLIDIDFDTRQIVYGENKPMKY